MYKTLIKQTNIATTNKLSRLIWSSKITTGDPK